MQIDKIPVAKLKAAEYNPRRALKPGGAAAISFNTLTLRKDTLLTLLQNAGFTPLTEPPYDDFSHFVEQAVHRDFIVARNEQP